MALHRYGSEGLIVISQPAHAWLSGQLARAWGNEAFGPVEPWEAVCLAAEQHDAGWADWEAAPELNPSTGRPYAFTEMPRAAHLAIWAGAARRVLSQGRYPALLVSLHATGLYARHDPGGDPAAEAAAIRDFVAGEEAFQAELLEALRRDPHYAPYTAPDVLVRNRRLVAVWDGMSIALCTRVEGAWSVPGVPTAAGSTSLHVTPIEEDPTRLAVTPWPFREQAVTLACEGRRLDGHFADTAALRAALARAPWVTLTFHLRPGRG